MTKRAERLELLYSRALNIFARYGYKKATVEDIAGEIGITKSGLYKYAKDKMDLYEKTLSHALIRWQARVVEAVNQEDDIIQKFIVMGRKGYEYLMEDEPLREVIKNDPAVFPHSTNVIRFREVNQRSLDLIERLLTEGILQGKFSKDIDVKQTSRLLYSIYRMFIVESYIISEVNQNKKMYINGIALLLNGLLVR
ncbi:MAG: TetR/AcrR family transcriptional regulator [Desulfobacter sp.]|nr:MAG: TetR/AcrR family transcriptional regulator [Desulfobacter sp.]